MEQALRTAMSQNNLAIWAERARVCGPVRLFHAIAFQLLLRNKLAHKNPLPSFGSGKRIFATISFGLTKTETFSIQIGMQWVDDVGGQTFIKKKPEDVVAVVSGSLESYFYVVRRAGTGTNPL